MNLRDSPKDNWLYNKFVCFLTGASGVGKSTFGEHLKSMHGDKKGITFFGFDSIGVPSNEEMVNAFGCPSEWQRAATKQWIKKILYEVDEPVVIIEGQVRFDFILEAFDRYQFKNFKIILIDCDEEEMIRRLNEDRGQPKLATEEMKNWRAYLKEQAKEHNIPIINTTEITIDEAAKKIELIVGENLRLK